MKDTEPTWATSSIIQAGSTFRPSSTTRLPKDFAKTVRRASTTSIPELIATYEKSWHLAHGTKEDSKVLPSMQSSTAFPWQPPFKDDARQKQGIIFCSLSEADRSSCRRP